MTRRAQTTLTRLGHEVRVCDLYGEGSGTLPKSSEFQERADESYFQLDIEQTHAFERDLVADDVLAQQRNVDWADLMILQFPLWWFSPPAIIKGWFERVFTRGWGYAPGHKFDRGHKVGKLAMLSLTTGTPAATYAPDGLDGDMLRLLWPVHNGFLRYLGLAVITPFLAYAPRGLDDQGRDEIFNAYDEHLASFDLLPRLFFHSLDEYGADMRLRPEVTPRSGFQFRPANPDPQCRKVSNHA
jgi:NAD(P)H dehydrogenase (quinone)